MDGLTGTVPLLEREAEVRTPPLIRGLIMDTGKEMENMPCLVYDWQAEKSVLYNSIRR